jgi:hypothetical protein
MVVFTRVRHLPHTEPDESDSHIMFLFGCVLKLALSSCPQRTSRFVVRVGRGATHSDVEVAMSWHCPALCLKGLRKH